MLVSLLLLLVLFLLQGRACYPSPPPPNSTASGLEVKFNVKPLGIFLSCRQSTMIKTSVFFSLLK